MPLHVTPKQSLMFVRQSLPLHPGKQRHANELEDFISAVINTVMAERRPDPIRHFKELVIHAHSEAATEPFPLPADALH